MFKWKLVPVVYHKESDFRSSPSIPRMRSTSFDESRYHENVCHIIFITRLLEFIDIISVTIEHIQDALVASILQFDFNLTNCWNKLFFCNKFGIQCSGDRRMILAIFPRTICATLIFIDDNLVLQDFHFRSHIIRIKISGFRHVNSLVNRIFTVGGLLLSILLLITQ